ncbi:tolloid-like protein 2 [Branchiostoma lanceolatum]|uniref:tolloid-like protein 2 n=1 Tax=Branchiostoma lanceolatum TaxID=7740 RepID=UPI0034539931
MTDESFTEEGFRIHYQALTLNLTGALCPDPGVPDNGYRSGDTFTAESTVSFGCHDGFILTGFYQSFCGFQNPIVYVSMASTLGLHFHSDDEIATTGFKIHYHVQNRSADDQKGYQRIHFLSEDAGSFSSMKYPRSPYSNDVYQQWSITVGANRHVKLMFTEFDVDETLYCFGDQVVIDDPYGSTRVAICGTCLPMPRISTGSILFVVFMTDFVIRRAGFSARYEAVEDRLEPSAPDALDSDWLSISDVRVKQISVSASTNQVWALDESGRPLRRTGITRTVPQGRAGVWVVYNHSAVMYRVGTFG